MKIEHAHLETFLRVAESGGFSTAARELGLTQPTVSYRIGRLEEEFGARLFEEPRRRAILTPAGSALYAQAVRSVGEMEALAERIGAGAVERPVLRIVTAGAFGRNVVFPALERAGLLGERVRLHFRSLEEIFDEVERGDADVGIAYDVRLRNQVLVRPIAQEEFCLIGPSGAEADDPQTLADFETLPFVTYEECDYVFGRWFEEVHSGRPTRLNEVAGFSRIEEVVETVAQGHGWSIVPSHGFRGRRREVPAEVRVVTGSGGRCFNREYAVLRAGWESRPEVDRLFEEVGAAAPL